MKNNLEQCKKEISDILNKYNSRILVQYEDDMRSPAYLWVISTDGVIELSSGKNGEISYSGIEENKQ